MICKRHNGKDAISGTFVLVGADFASLAALSAESAVRCSVAPPLRKRSRARCGCSVANALSSARTALRSQRLLRLRLIRHCSPVPSRLLSARRRGLRFTCGAFCGKRRSLLRRASSPQKVTLASATPFLTRALRLSLRYQPFAGNPAYTIFGKGTSRRCQPFAGNPAYTIFGKGTQMPPICHPALRPTE